jgi:enterobactin synthetase component D
VVAPASPEIVFDRVSEHGLALAVRIPPEPEAADALGDGILVEGERAFAAGLLPLRRRTWIAGRVATRMALLRLGLAAPAVLADERGAPLLPATLAGSISHKNDIAVALVAPCPSRGARIGVDIEMDAVGKIDISSCVLTVEEQAELAPLTAEARAREVLLRFSAKEAIYKALDPFVHRYVGFRELSVSLDAQGGGRVTSHLPRGEGPFAFCVRWWRFAGVVLTTARVELSDLT